MSGIKQVPYVQIGDFKLQQMQQNIISTVNDVLQNPLLSGRLITGISLSSGNNQIEHKLGREYLGYIIVSKNAAADIYVYDVTEKSTFIKLNSSAAVSSLSLWVF